MPLLLDFLTVFFIVTGCVLLWLNFPPPCCSGRRETGALVPWHALNS